MTIKKLTVAAAIAVGIATCSFNSAMAACPCNNSPTGPACPCQKLVTPENAKCPICGLEKSSCGCGCKKDSCGCNTPASGTYLNTCADLDMKQVYAYPNAIYGDNNYVGEQTNAIYSTETAWKLDCCDDLAACKAGLPIGAAAPIGGCGCASTSCGCAPTPCGCADNGVKVDRGCNPKCGNGCGCGCNTGAAASCNSGCLPVINTPMKNECGCNTGAAAPCCDCNTGCSTTVETHNSLRAIEKSFKPFTYSEATGAAAPLMSVFPDVPDGYWASCAIDRLAATNVIAGYPDRTFKPSLPVTRAEFASMMVKGLNLNLAGCDCLKSKSIFKDVPLSNWANPAIAKAVEDGIMNGYPSGLFKPHKAVSRAEALTAMAYGINCDIDSCKAKEILSKYCDGNKVPSWAQIPVAKALETGVLKNTPTPSTINPCKDASRADIASMLQSVRIAAGYDKDPTPTASNSCDCGCKKAYMETEQIVNIPTLKVKFLDEINAKSSRVGQQFAATTTEDITINGKCYKCGSRVNGKIVEVIRPSGCQKGALKVSFLNIQDCNGCKVDLPKQILSAKINCDRKQNAVARFVAMPFTLVGSLVGTTGRTIGGMISNAGNAVESVTNGTGIALGETFQGQFRAAGRSLQDAGKEAIIAPVDFARTALSGTMGLFQTTGDEVAYLVDPNGTKISAINPKETVTIAFGCH